MVPLQVGVAFAGGLQVVQLMPHVAGSVLDTHVPPHLWKPVTHSKPQVLPSHVETAWAGGEHGVQLEPHV